jgi:hypothetical protein
MADDKALSPDEVALAVGHRFVKSYYSSLSSQPEILHR